MLSFGAGLVIARSSRKPRVSALPYFTFTPLTQISAVRLEASKVPEQFILALLNFTIVLPSQCLTVWFTCGVVIAYMSKDISS